MIFYHHHHHHHHHYYYYCFFEIDLSVYPWLSCNSLCSPKEINSLCLPSAGIKCVHQHHLARTVIFKKLKWQPKALWGRDLDSQKCRQSWELRGDIHFCSHSWPKRNLPSALWIQDLRTVRGRNLPVLPIPRAEPVPQLSVCNSQGRKSCTLRGVNTPESSEETTTSTHISGPRRTCLVSSGPSGHRNLTAVIGRTLSVSACNRGWKPVARRPDTPETRGKTSSFTPSNSPEGAALCCKIHKNA